MRVTVYSASWCSGCKTVKKALAEANIQFKEVDITTQEGGLAAKELRIKSIPVTTIDMGGNTVLTLIGSKPETIKEIIEESYDKNYDTY